MNVRLHVAYIAILTILGIALTPAYADVRNPKEGYNVLDTLLFLPAAAIQLVAIDIPFRICLYLQPYTWQNQAK